MKGRWAPCPDPGEGKEPCPAPLRIDPRAKLDHNPTRNSRFRRLPCRTLIRIPSGYSHPLRSWAVLVSGSFGAPSSCLSVRSPRFGEGIYVPRQTGSVVDWTMRSETTGFERCPPFEWGRFLASSPLLPRPPCRASHVNVQVADPFLRGWDVVPFRWPLTSKRALPPSSSPSFSPMEGIRARIPPRRESGSHRRAGRTLLVPTTYLDRNRLERDGGCLDEERGACRFEISRQIPGLRCPPPTSSRSRSLNRDRDELGTVPFRCSERARACRRTEAFRNLSR